MQNNQFHEQIRLRDQSLNELAGTLLATNKIPSFQEAISIFRNSENPNDTLRSFFAKFHTMELWTREYIQGLLGHVEKTLSASENKIVLEVGAAEGRLTQRLQMASAQSSGEAEFFATDDFSYPNLNQSGAVIPVERVDYKDALKKFKPSIVICSGMDYEIDMTPEFRLTPSVQEYILIGQEGQSETNTRAYLSHEGFKRINLPQLSRFQISTWDSLREGAHSQHSQTVAFKREVSN